MKIDRENIKFVQIKTINIKVTRIRYMIRYNNNNQTGMALRSLTEDVCNQSTDVINYPLTPDRCRGAV